MVVIAIDSVSRLWRRVRPRHDDCAVDRLHYVLGPSILLFFALFHGVKQYFGKPVQCWHPAEMARRQWLKYVEGLCFVEDTYFVGLGEHFPTRRVDRQHREIHYYQWVPFLLLGQALLLVLPKFLWLMSTSNSSLNVSLLLRRFNALAKCGKCGKFHLDRKADERTLGTEMGKAISKALQRKQGNGLLRQQSAEDTKHEDAQFTLGRLITANWLTIAYLSYKALNLVSVLLQLYLLNKVVSPAEYDIWGWGLLCDLVAGRDWRQSGVFPRVPNTLGPISFPQFFPVPVTFCDVEVRQPLPNAPRHRYSFQCLLQMNMFNEKMYIFIWFGLSILAIVGAVDLLIWLRRSFIQRDIRQFIAIHLCRLRRVSPQFPSDPDREGIDRFVRECLGRDGCTALRLIDANCPPLVTAQLVSELWMRHRRDSLIAQQKPLKHWE